MKKSFLINISAIVGFCPFLLFADAPAYYQSALPQNPQYLDLPWLTGTLLSPSENVLALGQWNIEPYLVLNNQYGSYDGHWHSRSLPHSFYSLQVAPFFQYGIANRFDVQVVPQFSWNHTQGASQWTWGDLGAIIDYQLLYMKEGDWWPNIKLSLGASAPLGKYQNLSLKKKGTDKGGTGSINPSVGIVMGRVFQFTSFHFLRSRLFFEYTVPTAVHVKGLNTYGGGKGTRGVVYPGQLFTAIFGNEYSLSANWVLSCDLQYLHQNKQHFKGRTAVSMKLPSSEGWSLAPALEYNWNSSIGVISGVWFSFAGRNAPAFANWVSAVNVSF